QDGVTRPCLVNHSIAASRDGKPDDAAGQKRRDANGFVKHVAPPGGGADRGNGGLAERGQWQLTSHMASEVAPTQTSSSPAQGGSCKHWAAQRQLRSPGE